MGARRGAGQSRTAAARSVERIPRRLSPLSCWARRSSSTRRFRDCQPRSTRSSARRLPRARRKASRSAISCATCHDLARARRRHDVGARARVGRGRAGPTSTRWRSSTAPIGTVVFWNGRADSLWALNVVVAESPTTLNGNRLRTAHQIADRYAGFYDDVFAKRFGPLDIAAINKLPANGKPRDARVRQPHLRRHQECPLRRQAGIQAHARSASSRASSIRRSSE